MAHARAATRGLHLSDITGDGSSIIAEAYNPERGSIRGLYGGPKTIIPRGPGMNSTPRKPMNAAAPVWTPNRPTHNPGSLAPVDPLNIFIKNLDPAISSQDLFHAFKSFGRIISSRGKLSNATSLESLFK